MTDRSDSEDSSPENARASRHSILATKYQPTTTRATPDAIRDELRKLSPPSSAEARRALFTLAHALATVIGMRELQRMKHDLAKSTRRLEDNIAATVQLFPDAGRTQFRTTPNSPPSARRRMEVERSRRFGDGGKA